MRNAKCTNCKEIEITPLSKTDLLKTGKTSSFQITDTIYGQLKCRRKNLYEHIRVGEKIKVKIYPKYKLIRSIVGLEILEEIIEDDVYTPERCPSNKSESLLYKKLISEGWDITRRGWPDFACFKDGKFITIEVKPKRSHRLKTRQSQVMRILAEHGVDCYKWSPDALFEKITPNQENV